MEIEVSLKKGRRILAKEVVANPKNGDLTIIVGKVLAQARKMLDGPVWDCQIKVRQLP